MHEPNTTKRVPKISVKAKAALEDTTSNTRKAVSSNGLTDSTKVQPKKVKTNQPAGKKLATSKDSPAMPLPAQSHNFESALHAGRTIIHVGLDGSETESQVGGEDLQEDTNNASAEENEKDAEAELARLMKDWTTPIYSFFNPVPVIGHVNR
ncbi:hypothetical protein P692DRAFT_201872139 [Suillus brevipes Sb2]|nr:hypothetical protein P692DRAFT_201872139 [Suillus brevipes Sb2]